MRRAVPAFILVICGALILFAAGVYYGATQTRAWSETAQRQLRGELTEAEARFQEADLELGKARSRIKTEAGLSAAYRRDLAEMRNRTGLDRAVVSRASNADFSISGEMQPDNARVTFQDAPQGAGTARPYEYRLSGFRFATADIGDVATLPVLSFDIRAKLKVIGYRDPDGALETETVDLRFVDPNGDGIPLTVKVESYELEYAPMLPPPSWRDGFHVDLFAHAAAGYPFDPLLGRVAAGVDVRLWVLNVLAWGEGEVVGLRDEMGRYDIRYGVRAMFGIGGRWGLM